MVVAVDKGQCPPIAWHIIEFVLNALMVLEVTTRWIANGRVRFRFAIRSSNPIQFIHLKAKRKSKEKGELTGVVEIPYDPSQHHRPNPRFLLYPHPRPRLPEPLRFRYEKGRTPRHYPHRRP